ncbi:MAG: tetratricopeptide repeat protein [Candidatus Korobacteraceae bacterium]
MARTATNLAAALLLKVNLEGAIHALQPARKMNPRYGIADSYRGLAYARKRDFGGARKALEAALKLKPDFPD